MTATLLKWYILLKITYVLSSKKLLFLSKETNAQKGKCFCVVVVLFAYFGIYALEL